MARVPLMVGNWKMSLDYLETIQLVNQLYLSLTDHHHNFDTAEVAMIPSFASIRSVQATIDGDNMEIRYDAQGVFVHNNRAFTGEVSTATLIKLGCAYMVVEYSECREYHNEADTVVNAKAREVLTVGIVPVVCRDEVLDVRKTGEHVEHVSGQIATNFADISAAEAEKYVVVYEPIWAIGIDETTTPQDAQKVYGAVRQKLAKIYSAEVTDKMRIPYDGSVKSANVVDIMTEPDMDGDLVGGASLKAEEFDKTCRIGK